MTLPETMRLVRAEQLGPVENYVLVEMPLVPPGPGEVLVRMHATSLGFADVLVTTGLYQVKPPVPFVPGSEGSGEVAAVGAGVSGWAVGDRVCITRFSGGLGEYVLAQPAELHPFPRGLSFLEAAIYRVNYATMLHALKDRALVQPGETLLVLGAAGGVGTAAVQLGKLMGARVIAGASTAAKREFARSLGADEVLDYSVDNWRDALKALTGGRGVDVVADPVGGKLFEPAFRSLAWKGRHIVIGFAGGDIPRLPANLPLLKGAALIGADIRQFGIYEPELADANAAQIVRWCESGLRPPVGPVFDFTRYREAMTAASAGQSLGKVVVQITDPSD
ncbi:MAG TPA: NADPH:quinone oxidoreductase family protein [Novosphingobium sp.]|nr:NADPH:quinone oxidoreductase family protein [Novosphingobium sp.]